MTLALTGLVIINERSVNVTQAALGKLRVNNLLFFSYLVIYT